MKLSTIYIFFEKKKSIIKKYEESESQNLKLITEAIAYPYRKMFPKLYYEPKLQNTQLWKIKDSTKTKNIDKLISRSSKSTINPTNMAMCITL